MANVDCTCEPAPTSIRTDDKRFFFRFFFLRFTDIPRVSSSPSSYGSFKPQLYPSTSRKAKGPAMGPSAFSKPPGFLLLQPEDFFQLLVRHVADPALTVLTVDSANFRFVVSIALMRSSKVPAEMNR